MNWALEESTMAENRIFNQVEDATPTRAFDNAQTVARACLLEHWSEGSFGCRG